MSIPIPDCPVRFTYSHKPGEGFRVAAHAGGFASKRVAVFMMGAALDGGVAEDVWNRHISAAKSRAEADLWAKYADAVALVLSVAP